MPNAREQTILLVEDDDQLRRLLSLALRLAGFVTREARDGLEALAILEWSRFDGVLVDLALPYLDGVSVLQEIATHAWGAGGSLMQNIHCGFAAVKRCLSQNHP